MVPVTSRAKHLHKAEPQHNAMAHFISSHTASWRSSNCQLLGMLPQHCTCPKPRDWRTSSIASAHAINTFSWYPYQNLNLSKPCLSFTPMRNHAALYIVQCTCGCRRYVFIRKALGDVSQNHKPEKMQFTQSTSVVRRPRHLSCCSMPHVVTATAPR